MSQFVEYTPTTIESVDRAIRDWFDKTVNVRVTSANNELMKVPVNFSSGERWATGRTKQGFRDSNGVLILPIIAVRRTNISPDPTKMALGTQTENIQIAKLVDPKSNDIKNLEGLKPEQFRRKYPAIYDVYTIPFPNSLVANYQLVIQAQYITQMNEILQKIWRSLDIQKSFVAPFENDGRHTPRSDQFGGPYRAVAPLKGPYVVGFLEGDASDAGNFEEFTDSERIIKYTTNLSVPFVMHNSPEGEVPAVQITRTAYKAVFKDENFTFVDDPEELDKIFGKLK
jgi:hypothetical protein